MTSPPPAGFERGGRFDDWDRPAISYVALDMDGTVLRSDDAVAPETKQAMLDAVRRGVAVGMASGRMRNGAVHIHQEVPVPGPHIFHDGAEVRAEQKTIAAWPLAPDAVTAILDLATDTGSYCELYGTADYYITGYRAGAEVHWKSLHRDPAGDTASADMTQTFFKATFIGFDPVETVAIESGARSAGLDVGTAKATGVDWDFVNVKMPGVNKGKALEAVAEYLDIPLTACMAVGDGFNDIPMLTRTGTAVAMGQSAEPIRQAAHLVTLPVDAHGAAFALDQLASPTS